MLRPNSLRIVVAPVLILAMMIMVGCGGGGEEKTTLKKYFNASKMRDNLTLANIATVAFDPAKDGQVQSFSVVSTAPETVTPLTLKQHQADLKAAQDAETEFGKRKKEFQDANGEAIERILKAEGKSPTLKGKDAQLKGKDAQLQKEWTKWRDETQGFAKKVSETRKAVNADRPVVEISVLDTRDPVDVTAYDGEVVSKDVTIDATVKLPDGTSADKQYVFTIERATLNGVVGKDGKAGNLVGRWVITKFVEVGK